MIARAGVLALQGAFAPHLAVLQRLGCPGRAVRRPADLEGLTHLILPGGESTTLRHLLDLFDLVEPIRAGHRAGRLRLFGVCAGAILMGRSRPGVRPRPLGLIDVELQRNAYGEQRDSFRAELDGDGAPRWGLFIRAPRMVTVGPGLEILARHAGDPVLVEGPGALVATFHPELSGCDGLHRRFLGPAPPGPSGPG